MQNKDKTLLSVKDLSASIGRQIVLSKVSLEIEQGECVAIVGGSGAGKSCLLRSLMGLYKPARPYEGHMVFRGEETDFSVRRSKRRDQSGFAFVPQNPQSGLDPLKRLSFQWRQALRCVTGHAASKDEQTQLLGALGLKSFERSFPLHWSQGMQQRLLIAFALLARPDLLVMDEPTSALDPLIAAKTITKVMDHARQSNIAVLIVTHDLSLAARFANRVGIMHEGKMVEYGPTEQLLQHPNSDYGKLLVANRDWLHPTRTGGNKLHVIG